MQLVDIEQCTGCGACISICPKKCVSTIISQEGFSYPKIDEGACIECGNCLRVCPVKNRNIKRYDQGRLMVGYCKHDIIRSNSSSGGAFWILAHDVLKNSGIVYGAAFLEDFSVAHIRVDNVGELRKCMTSKYVQSIISKEIYEMVKLDIINDKTVIFTGTPCQINGLVGYLGNLSKKQNLLLVAVVCHGVASPGIWKSYLQHKSEKFKSKINSVNFRDKLKGWHNFCMVISFENGKKYVCSHHVDKYMRLYLDNLILRKSCYSCSSKGELNRADISIADAWTIESEKKNMNDDKGISLVILHSQKGSKWWNRASCNEKFEESEMNIEITNAALFKSAEYNTNRTMIMNKFENLDMDTFWNSIHVSWKKRIIYLFRCICDMFGISNILRTKKRKAKR